MYEQQIVIKNEDELRELFGHLDTKINYICKAFSINVSTRNNNHLTISGNNKENIKQAGRLIEDLLTIIRRGNSINLSEIKYQIEMLKDNNLFQLNDLYKFEIQVFKKDKIIRPKTYGQKIILEKINNNEILFVIGPAGTGKTYLAVAIAISALRKKEIDRIILVRPAVEAGESLGFLPGDLMEKIDPYFRPLYDAIYEMMPSEKFQNFLERGTIEIAPLAYMRGRTLNNSFIILDDAQNTTLGQMKMFLTRFGFGSKIIVTGDITQIDLPQKDNSGLISIAEILKDINGISFVYLGKRDVVRHRLVKEIILAYEKASKSDNKNLKNLGKNNFIDENR